MSKPRVVIDAGHGGIDDGASYGDVKEKELALKISHLQLKELKKLNFSVVLTRYGDETLRAKERIKRINNFKPHFVLSNHINAGGGEGAEIIYSKRDDGVLADMLLDSIVEKGQRRRRIYTVGHPNLSGKDYFFINRNTLDKTQALIIEYGFIDRKDDRENLLDNWHKYANAVVVGLKKYVDKNNDMLEYEK